MITRRKAYIYITRGAKLLVFSHPDHPEAGIQVPGGTIEDDESPSAGALREAEEETGLTGFVMKAFLGEVWQDMGDNIIHHRHFYHFLSPDDAPKTWSHGEHNPSDGSTVHRFDFYWVDLSEAPTVLTYFGEMLHKISV